MRSPSTPYPGLSPRQAALTAGAAYLFNPAAIVEAHLYPRLVIPGNIQQTVANIADHRVAFGVVILCYLFSFMLDIVLAWALFELLAPVNRALSLLMAWLQIIYAGIALYSTVNMATVFNLLGTPDYVKTFGLPQTLAQVRVLILSFRSGFDLSLTLFGIHLVLLGYLLYRSNYGARLISRAIGILLAINGLAWVINSVGPFLFPDASFFKYLFVAFGGEIVFMFWLLIAGWKMQRPAPQP